jgi:quaternary ammonium compound-resistance protein SugE
VDAGDECQHEAAIKRKRDVVIPLVLSSVAFAIGGAFMKPSVGFTRLVPSGIVLSCFLLGAVGMTMAVQRGSLGRTYLVGLGLEAVAAVAIGVVVLGERMSTSQTAGIALVISGLMLVRL